MEDSIDRARRKKEIETFFEEIERFAPTPLIGKELVEEMKKRRIRTKRQNLWPNLTASNGTAGAVTNANLG